MDFNIELDQTLCNEVNDAKMQLMDLSKLNEELRAHVERCEAAIKLPRSTHSILNNAIASTLRRYVTEHEVEDGCCYFVKNINQDANICFVHAFTPQGKSFQNLTLSGLPQDMKKGDVLVQKEGQIVVEPEITNTILALRKRILESLKNSIELFRVEGKTYFICDKSDDIMKPKMSLRIEETNQEYWGIDIDEELYKQIRYGSKVVYTGGQYTLLEENN